MVPEVTHPEPAAHQANCTLDKANGFVHAHFAPPLSFCASHYSTVGQHTRPLTRVAALSLQTTLALLRGAPDSIHYAVHCTGVDKPNSDFDRAPLPNLDLFASF